MQRLMEDDLGSIEDDMGLMEEDLGFMKDDLGLMEDNLQLMEDNLLKLLITLGSFCTDPVLVTQSTKIYCHNNNKLFISNPHLFDHPFLF